MKQKFKFKALTYEGKIKHFTKEFDCPDFKVIPPITVQGVPLPETTIHSQLIDWIDEQDKTDLMNEMELYIIMDYWIPKNKVQKLSIMDYLRHANVSEHLLLDIMATYKEIKPTLKGKSVENQISLILSHLDIGYKSAQNAYSHMSKLLNASSVDDMKSIIEASHSNQIKIVE